MLSRRQTFTGAVAGLTLPVLAACGSDDSGDGTGATDSAEDTNTPQNGSGGDEGGDGQAEDGLVAADDVPVGGGVVVEDQEVVITQPSEGDYKGWSAVCTHQGCLVTEVQDGQINCPCHGSRFSVTDGSVVTGPAEQPLDEVPLNVDGGTITLA